MAGTCGFGVYILTKQTMNFKEYFNVGEVFTYFFRKKDPNASLYMKMMYWAQQNCYSNVPCLFAGYLISLVHTVILIKEIVLTSVIKILK